MVNINSFIIEKNVLIDSLSSGNEIGFNPFLGYLSSKFTILCVFSFIKIKLRSIPL